MSESRVENPQEAALPENAQPVTMKERAVSLDVLRGVAVLGILAMNIRLFAMPQAAYFNITAYGDLSGINHWLMWFTNVFADQKFMTLFSLMFGAGMVLMSERMAAKGQKSTGLLLRRNFWLLLIGLAHAYLIWYGDILVAYAICGCLVLWCRNWRPGIQLALGLGLFAIPSLIFIAAGASFSQWPAEAVEATNADWAPGAAALAEELAIYRGGWVGQLSNRIATAVEFQTGIFLIYSFWRVTGLMLLGMAFYRWGYFTAERSNASYRRWALLGLVVSVPALAYAQYLNEQSGWSYAEVFFVNGQFNYWGSLFMALAYLSLVMLWCKGGLWPSLKIRMAAVGRMAFSNYLGQSLICTFIFYGHGLGLYGHVERWQQLLLVLLVWVLSLVVSPWWLARYRFGPMEWLWRSLTYWQLQPLRRSGDS